MAGVDVGGGGNGKRKSLDSEINMIPMIDLLLVTISFLLITAVWSMMARINADAQVLGPPRPEEEVVKKDPEKQLHIGMPSNDKFTLTWKQGQQVVNQMDLPRNVAMEEKLQASKDLRTRAFIYPELAKEIEKQWKEYGQHNVPTERVPDQAILHTANGTPYWQIIGVLDAVYATQRPFTVGGKAEKIPAFNVTFSVN